MSGWQGDLVYRSAETIDVHAQCTHSESLVGDAEIPPGRAGKVQRQQVFIAGMIAHGIGCPLAIIVQGCLVVGRKLFDHPVPERLCPRLHALRAGMPIQFSQVMGDAAGADQQYAVLAQAAQRLSDVGLQGRTATGW